MACFFWDTVYTTGMFLSLRCLQRRRQRPCVLHCSVRPSVHASETMFPQYLQYLLTDFRQTFVTDASWDKGELIRFWDQKVEGQGHIIAAEASTTRLSSFIMLNLFRHALNVVQSFCTVVLRKVSSVSNKFKPICIT